MATKKDPSRTDRSLLTRICKNGAQKVDSNKDDMASATNESEEDEVVLKRRPVVAEIMERLTERDHGGT